MTVFCCFVEGVYVRLSSAVTFIRAPRTIEFCQDFLDCNAMAGEKKKQKQENQSLRNEKNKKKQKKTTKN